MNSLRSFMSRLSLLPSSTTSASLPQHACLSTSSALSRNWGPGWGPTRGPYLSLFSINHDGKRRGFRAAHERFKRLDWGMFIRPRAGRDKKHWKKSPYDLWNLEQHIFCAPFHVRRLERMFSPEVKRARFIPDDPYLKYNNTPFHRHKWTKLKNAENIRLFGNKVYLFNRWKAHLSKHATKYNVLEKFRYEPPGYVGNLAANRGVYSPEFVPADTQAPHFQRPPIRVNKIMKDFHLGNIKDYETYYGQLDLWHPLLKDMYKKF